VSGSEKKILLIEDNPGDAVLISEMLSGINNYALTQADRLSSGLQLLRQNSFNVVLLDLGLPDSSGIETFRRVQSERPEAPVIVLTGLTDEEIAVQAISQGAQDFLVKGRIDGELLTRAIRYAVERKRAQQLLRHSEEKFRAFFESAGIGATQLDLATGRFLKVNARFCQITGYSQEELRAMTFRDITHPEDLERDSEGFLRMVSGKAPDYVAEKRYIRKDRCIVWVQISATLVRDAYGKPLGTAGIVQDITMRKQAEEKLRASEERFRAAVDYFPDVFVIYNAERQLQFVNAAAQKLVNMPLEAFLGKRIEEITPPEIHSQWLPLLERAMASRSVVSGEITLPLPDNYIIQNSTFVPLLDDHGRIFQVLGIAQDITARKKIEEERQKSQKLESIGLLAGGIAHDFNNILTAILGNITLAKMVLPPGDKSADRLTLAEQASLRARNLAQQLLTFAKGGAPIKETISVPHLLEESAALALRGSRIKGQYFFPADLWPIEADESQLLQAINNLTINAVQAMPGGGILEFHAANDLLTPENKFGLPAGKYVRIAIRDHGSGIPKKDQQRIFDPYFTTKETGSGLGLTISFSIVKRHGGTIIVDSTPDEGSTFTLFLPAAAEIEVGPQAEDERELIPGNSRVLVMDDDEAVKEIASEMLQHLGYRVATANDGAAAIAAYRQAMAAGEPFDAVIMDLTVPAGMGGKETVRRLLAIDPQARVIVSSGYGNDPIMSDYAEYGFKGVIPKPYRMKELGRALQKVIGSEA
jgi:two-component system, cell cycle sensor histidine kinase and response regulator CckA